MYHFKSLFLPMLLSASGALANVVYAAEPYDGIQRRDLSLIQGQLNQVVTVLDRLEARQAGQAGQIDLYLDIPRVRADVHAIQRGLDEYLSPSRMPPRRLEPMEDDVVGRYLGQKP